MIGSDGACGSVGIKVELWLAKISRDVITRGVFSSCLI